MGKSQAQFVLVCALAAAGANSDCVFASEQASPLVRETPLYKAPSENRAPRRVGGNPRGAPPSLPTVAVLAPDHLGLTVSEQPQLFWYLSAPTTARIELILVDPSRDAPLVETVAAGDRAGIQSFQPGAHGVRLEIGVQYEWSVAVVADPAQRSRDIIAAGAIMRIVPSAALGARLQAASAEIKSAAYAGEGVWYDALGAMAAEIAVRPGDRALRGRRAALLEQAGLVEAAAFDRRQ